MNWQNDNYRKLMLNAILWTAGMKVPQKGVPSTTPGDEEMHANLDPKAGRKPLPEAKPAPRPVAKNTPPPSFNELRARSLKHLDSRANNWANEWAYWSGVQVVSK